MSEELIEELNKEGKKKKKEPDYSVEVRHVEGEKGDDGDLAQQLAEERKRRKAAENIITIEAEKSWIDEKEAFLNLVTDPKKRSELDEKIGDDPSKLNEIKRLTSFLVTALKGSGVQVTGLPVSDDDKPAEKTVSGRATLPQRNQSGGVAETYKDYVDELYEILKDPEKSAKEKKIADQKINELYASMILGIKSSKATQRGDMPYLPSTSSCPNCGAQLIGDLESCPSCGWKLYAKNFTPRR